jgi:ribonuclease P protein component
MDRRHRLRSSSEFRRALKNGRSWSHPVVVLCVVGNDLDYSRIGFVTSKRIGGAVVRNRVRRLMREALRAQLPAIVPGRDLVWIARSASAQADYQQMVEAVNALLRRAGCVSVSTDGTLQA